MINTRMLAVASALALFVPAVAVALPSMWPGDDPSALIVEGGAEQYARVDNITTVDPPQSYVTDMNTTLGHEQLVEGHTTFATIDIVKHAVSEHGSVNLMATVNCYAETGWDGDTWFGIPFPSHVHTTTAQCIENATLVAMPNPLYQPSTQRSSLAPDGNVYPFTTPTGETGYETEYSFDVSYQDADGYVHHQTQYAWGVSPVHPWVDASGVVRSLYMSLPSDKLAEMGIHDFSIVDSRTLDVSL
jgi:hypothetical protein